VEADLAQSILQEDGVRALVSGDSEGWAPHLAVGGMKLMVLEDDLDRAEKLLSERLGE
jgi:hypothetical protein